MIRVASREEAEALVPSRDGYATTVLVLERDGRIAGHLALSEAFGQVFGHETVVESPDASDAARLWLYAREWVRARGYDRVMIHTQPSTEAAIVEFWKRQGAALVCEIYQVDL